MSEHPAAAAIEEAIGFAESEISCAREIASHSKSFDEPLVDAMKAMLEILRPAAQALKLAPRATVGDVEHLQARVVELEAANRHLREVIARVNEVPEPPSAPVWTTRLAPLAGIGNVCISGA